MFTGLIKELGTVKRVERTAHGMRWTITAPGIAALVETGDSVNVAGACQTVETVGRETITGTAVPETLRLTTCARWHAGSRVNLEPALRADDRLGGHLVSGHVDTTGRVSRIVKGSGEVRITVAFASQFDTFSIPKGSLALDGVSLTIAAKNPGAITVALIPETLQRTTLGSLHTGDPVNLEFDQTIKAVVAALSGQGVNEAFLSEAGF